MFNFHVCRSPYGNLEIQGNIRGQKEQVVLQEVSKPGGGGEVREDSDFLLQVDVIYLP